MSRVKRIIIILTSVWLVAGLTACGGESKWIFSLNGEKLYNKEITVFGLIYTKEYNIVNKKQMNEQYEDGDTYGEHYKKELEDEIVSTVLLYVEAKEAGYKLTKEEKETAEKSAESLMDSCGREWVEEQDISNSDIERVYEMKFLANSYIEGLSEGAEKKSENEQYIKVYQVLFSTIALDDNGMIKSNQDGTAVSLSDAQIAKRKEQAVEFAEKVHDGTDMEVLLKSYDKTVTGVEKYLKYDDLEAGYKQAVDKTSEGRVSDVVESAYGYYVVKLLEKNAENYATMMNSYAETAASQKKKDEILDKLYNAYVRDDKKYKNQKRWDTVSIVSMLQS